MNNPYRHLVLFLFILITFIMSGCSSDSGSGQPTSNAATKTIVKGNAVKGPVAIGTVSGYAVVNGAIAAKLGETTTAADGSYRLSLGNYNGPVLLEIIGGTYIDEATGNTIAMSNTPGKGLTAVVDVVLRGQTLDVQITAVTTLATELAKSRPGSLTPENINASNGQMGQFFGGIDIVNTQPINPMLANATVGSSQPAIDYGLILAGFSQQAEILRLTDPMELVRALGEDISDRIFDGQKQGVPVFINGVTQLMATAATMDLAAGIDSFSKNTTQNASGATVSSGLLTQLQTATGELTVDPPTGLSAVAGQNLISVSWNAVSGVTSYNLYYSTSSGLTTGNGTKITGASSPYILNNPGAGVTYYFIVTAVNSTGESVPSNLVFATTTPLPPNIVGVYSSGPTTVISSNCAKPADNGPFTFSTGSLEISSQTGTAFIGTTVFQADIVGFLVISTQQLTGTISASGQLNGTFDDTLTLDGQLDSSGSGTFTGQVSGNTIMIQLDGQDTVGDICSYTVDVTFNPSINTIPNPPTGVSAVPDDSQVTVSWNAVSNATSYNIYWNTTEGVTTSDNKIANVTSPYVHTNRTNGTKYYYVVTAVNSAGESTTSVETENAPTFFLASKVAAGRAHSIVIKQDGSLWTWGYNFGGQLGIGNRTDSRRPVQVCDSGEIEPCKNFLTNVSEINGGYLHTVALKSDGTVWNWGRMLEGTLAIAIEIPIQVNQLTNVKAVAAGVGQSIALKNDGTVWTWGWNKWGQLGDGTINDSLTPVQVCDAGEIAPCSSFLTNIIAVDAKDNRTLALRDDGTVWTWGASGNSGRLGDGRRSSSSTPVQVCDSGQIAPCSRHLSNIIAISAGGTHTLALKNDGTVWAWGSNSSAQLGDGTTSDSLIPIQVCNSGQTAPCSSFLSNVKAVASRGDTSLVLKNDGTVWAWGSGPLGDGSTSFSLVPVQVSNLTNVVEIAAGSGHFIVLKNDGTVWIWGGNFLGQIGDGTGPTVTRYVPVQVR